MNKTDKNFRRNKISPYIKESIFLLYVLATIALSSLPLDSLQTSDLLTDFYN